MIKFLPYIIRRRLEQRPDLVKILNNIGWLFFDKFLRMGVGLLIGIWIARYLGPTQFGLLNYALALTGLVSAVATLGLQSIVVRDVVHEPEGAKLTLGTAALLQFFGGLISFLIILVAIYNLRPDDSLAQSVVILLGATLLFKMSDVATYWFESQIQSKYTVWVQNAVFSVFAIIKVILILNQVSLITLIWTMLAEAVIAALAMIIALGRLGHAISTLVATWRRAGQMLQQAWPLALSGMAVVIYMKLDQIMLGEMMGDDAVGVFTAAIKISEVWYFIPMAIVASTFPAILQAKRSSQEVYIVRLQRLYDLLVSASILVALPMTFLADTLIEVLYGGAYSPAGTVLAIHIWASIFVCLGVVSSQYLIAENRQIIALQRTCAGLVVNVVLNFFLIPRHGPIGAAVATVISQVVATFLFDIFQKETRIMFNMKLKSLIPFRFLITKKPTLKI